MALTIEELVDALRISRSEFGRIFVQAQMDVVENPGDRVLFDAVSHSGVDREAFAEALRWAQQNQYLDRLVRAIVGENLEDGRITAALATEAAAASQDEGRKATLQAMTDRAKGFLNPEVFFRGVNIGMRWTVKILLNGAFSGTGILIGPHLVLTAWHVVHSLFDPAGNNRFTARPNAASSLSVEFDDLTGLLDGRSTTAVPQRIPAHVQWCAAHSECHPEELADWLPKNLAELDGFWDYTVLRLAKTPGLERRWASLDARAVVPAAQARIIVFQYPAGQPMRFDENEVVAPEPAAAGAIPRYRFLHLANTLGGSSGGPCFDRTFMLFGLHQGQWVRVPADGPVINRGVPILRIKEHIQQSIRDLPVPDPSESPVWKLGPADLYAPVVGCDEFQRLVWKSAVAGSPRLLLLRGEARTGKTFRLSVLSAMLPDSGHLKLLLRAEAISKMDALQLAAEICKAAGAALPAFVPAAEFNSTLSTWLRDELTQKVIQALEGARSGRLVWLMLAELNKADIQGENASAFLLTLYEQARTAEWLRIVLDGMKGDTLSSLRNFTEPHRIPEVTRAEIETYLRRAIAESETPVEDVIRALSGAAYKRYVRWLNDNSSDSLEQLSDLLKDLVVGYFER
jgi:V8-like Glu-specific endopeptidase